LARQFNDILTEFQKVTKLSLQKEREHSFTLSEGSSFVNNPGGGRYDSFQAKLQENKIDELIIQQRNSEIKQIEQNLEELAECFVDVAKTVDEQGEQLTIADKNTAQAAESVSSGVKEVSEAAYLKSKIRQKKCLILIFTIVLLLIIVAIIVGVVCSKTGSCHSSSSS